MLQKEGQMATSDDNPPPRRMSNVPLHHDDDSENVSFGLYNWNSFPKQKSHLKGNKQLEPSKLLSSEAIPLPCAS